MYRTAVQCERNSPYDSHNVRSNLIDTHDVVSSIDIFDMSNMSCSWKHDNIPLLWKTRHIPIQLHLFCCSKSQTCFNLIAHWNISRLYLFITFFYCLSFVALFCFSIYCQPVTFYFIYSSTSLASHSLGFFVYMFLFVFFCFRCLLFPCQNSLWMSGQVYVWIFLMRMQCIACVYAKFKFVDFHPIDSKLIQ